MSNALQQGEYIHQMSEVNNLTGGWRGEITVITRNKALLFVHFQPIKPPSLSASTSSHPTEHICDEADNISSQINNKL